METACITLPPLPEIFDKASKRETESFLRQIESRRKMWRREMTKHVPQTPAAEALRLIERIEKAFTGVT